MPLPLVLQVPLLTSRAPDGPPFWGVWGAYLVRGPKRELFLSLWSSPLPGPLLTRQAHPFFIYSAEVFQDFPQFTYWVGGLLVEHLKVRVYLLGWGVNSRACLRILNSRAPKGP